MSFEDMLNQVRSKSISHIVFSQSDEGKEWKTYESQLESFFDRLSESLIGEDPSLITSSLDDLLSAWSEIEPVSQSLNTFIHIFLSIYQRATAVLSGAQAGELIEALMPSFTFGIQYIHQQDLDKSVSKVVQELSQERYSLERLDKSKSDFISIAAHELKTPLTLIEGYSAMLREIVEQKNIFDEHIIQLIDGMDSGSRRLQEIINDMIDVSLIDNDMLSLSYQPVWINKLLDRIEVAVEPIIQIRQLTLDVRKFKGDDRMFFSDGERIFQALYNVISNAIKFTPDGGKIVVDGNTYDEFLELLIIDNGIGIDPQDQKKIFEKFQPISDTALHTSGKQKFMGGGPGLGLPIAKGIIEAHGGRIWVESDGYNVVQCPGSTFHILLPMRHEPPENWAVNLFEPLKGLRSNRESRKL